MHLAQMPFCTRDVLPSSAFLQQYNSVHAQANPYITFSPSTCFAVHEHATLADILPPSARKRGGLITAHATVRHSPVNKSAMCVAKKVMILWLLLVRKHRVKKDAC
jgi:hypothetical protein